MKRLIFGLLVFATLPFSVQAFAQYEVTRVKLAGGLVQMDRGADMFIKAPVISNEAEYIMTPGSICFSGIQFVNGICVIQGDKGLVVGPFASDSKILGINDFGVHDYTITCRRSPRALQPLTLAALRGCSIKYTIPKQPEEKIPGIKFLSGKVHIVIGGETLAVNFKGDFGDQLNTQIVGIFRAENRAKD